jgi:xylulokinase
MGNEPDMSDKESRQHVLAIDLGSSTLKTAIVADSGAVVASAEAPVRTHFLPGGGAEQDPREWWESTRRTVREVMARSGLAPEAIGAVACDSQWSVVVPVDDRIRPLMGAVHWMDTRGGIYNRALMKGVPRVAGYGLFNLLRWIRLTGLAPTLSGVDSLGHVLFIKHAHPEVYGRTRAFLEPMDFLTSRLTGRIAATQKTMAPFALTDNRRWGSTDYSDDLLRRAGLAKEKFPPLMVNNGVAGPLETGTAHDLGLLPTTPVVAGIADSNATLIGSGAVEDFESIISIGTSLYMTCHLPFKKTDLTHFMTSLPSPLPDRYYLLGEQGAGGKCVDFFLRQMVFPEDEFQTGPMPADAYARFNAMAARAPAGSGGVIFLPWLNGAIVPSEAPQVRGGFMNLSFNTTRRHMARAVMEALAYNNRWTRRPAEKFIGRPIPGFRLSGGGALSDLWCQIHADVLQVPIHQVADPVNATARGTAFLALVALGYFTLEDIPRRVGIKQVFEPNPAHRILYDKLYRQYRRLFKRNKPVFAALNDEAGN